MAKYFAHKPSWRGGSSRGSTSTSAPVLEMKRSPSGDFNFSGDVYQPPANSGGRRTGGGTSVPNAGYAWNKNPYTWRNPAASRFANLQARLSGFSSGLNLALQLTDPSMIQGMMDWGWDDFKEGRLPPPFDWLNGSPTDWMGSNGEKGADAPPGSVATLSPDGKWYALFPPYDTASYAFWKPGFPNDGWPPPGNYPWDILPDVKLSQNVYIDVPWGTIDTTISADTHLDVGDGSGPNAGQLVWLWGMRGYSKLNDGVQDRGELFGALSLEWPYNGGVKPTLVPNGLPLTNVGDTQAEALQITVRSPGVIPWGTPAQFPNYMVPVRNLIGEMMGTHVTHPGEVDPVNDGGTKVIAPPGLPPVVVPTKPGEPAHPPGNGTKEKKARVGSGLFRATQHLFHSITEYGDFVDALFDAIPKSKRCKTKSLVGKSACVFAHLDDIDIGDAIVNLAWNQFEDYVIGKGLFAANQKAARARGDPYGFRTANSVNDYGGLDELGKLYGDFSKEYVNPSKDKLKSFLTNRFGI